MNKPQLIEKKDSATSKIGRPKQVLFADKETEYWQKEKVLALLKTHKLSRQNITCQQDSTNLK